MEERLGEAMKMKRQLYLDLDGVLADFDSHYQAKVGALPDRADTKQDVDWQAVEALDLFASVSPMADAHELWAYVKHHDPVILTGGPTVGFVKAAKAKKDWVKKHFGGHVPVVVTKAKLKSQFCRPGDVIVDDYPKYEHLWVGAGGKWVPHSSAADTIAKLKELGL